jgi:hypothetical protein
MDQDDVPITSSFVHAGDGSATSAAGDVIDQDAIIHDIFSRGEFLFLFSPLANDNTDVSNPDLSTTSTPPSTGF